MASGHQSPAESNFGSSLASASALVVGQDPKPEGKAEGPGGATVEGKAMTEGKAAEIKAVAEMAAKANGQCRPRSDTR